MVFLTDFLEKVNFERKKKKKKTTKRHAKLPSMQRIKAAVTTVADDILFFYYYYFSEKIRLSISCKLSARQMIHMNCQALFCQKMFKKEQYLRVPSTTILYGTLTFIIDWLQSPVTKIFLIILFDNPLK